MGPGEKHITDQAMQRRLQEDALAADIIEEARVQLMLKFRFLDLALWRMDLEPARVGAAYPLLTDGKKVYYDPPRIIARFQNSFDELARDYLHMIMHCIFRHPYDRDHKVREAWSLTCDIIAESVSMDLCGDRFPSEDDKARRNALNEIMMLTGGMIPNRIYDIVKGLVQTPEGHQFQGLGKSTLTEWHALFERDDHGAWPANNDSKSDEKTDDPQEVVEDDENPEMQHDGLQTETLGTDESGEEESRSSQDVTDNAQENDNAANEQEGGEDADATEALMPNESESDEDIDEQEREWEELAKEIEMNLGTFSREWGEQAGSLVQALSLANRKQYDYTDFLRRFMIITEEIKLNQDEFDYTYYTYGMSLYGNMPLVEPLEYKETDAIRDFVIAIDTSESVSGDLVKRFIEHTFSILKESEDHATKVNIHIIQADSKVQSDLKITDLRDVDRLMEGFAVRGFGGTDFRPTFDYVEMLRKRGEFTDLKGLIYFTDGFGDFPEKTPDYDAAFVFLDDGSRELPPVPPWAMKLVIDENDINRLKG